MAVTGCQFVALTVNHVQSRTSGFLESTGALELQIAIASANILKMSRSLAQLAVISALSVTLLGQRLFAAPTTSEQLVMLAVTGRKQVQQKKYDEALLTLSKALAMNPTARQAAEIYGERGGVYVEKGELDKAMSDAEAAVRLAPNYFRGYQVRGRIYRHRKQLDRALQEFGRALQLAPQFAQLYNNRGNVFTDKGQPRLAIQDFTEAIRRAPKALDGYVNRGGSYLQIREFDRAIADLNKAIQLFPNDSDAYYNRGLAHMGKDDYQTAIADFTRARALSPRDPEISHAIAEARAKLGESPRPRTSGKR